MRNSIFLTEEEREETLEHEGIYYLETSDGVFRIKVPASHVIKASDMEDRNYRSHFIVIIYDEKGSVEAGFSKVYSIKRAAFPIQKLTIEDILNEQSTTSWADLRTDWPVNSNTITYMQEAQYQRRRRQGHNGNQNQGATNPTFDYIE